MVKERLVIPDPNHTGGRQPVRLLDEAHMTSGKAGTPLEKWNEISLEMDALGSTLKEKTHTWNKSCKESVKRESDLDKMIKIAAMNERQEDKERSVLKEIQRNSEKMKTRLEHFSKKCSKFWKKRTPELLKLND